MGLAAGGEAEQLHSDIGVKLKTVWGEEEKRMRSMGQAGHRGRFGADIIQGNQE